MKIKTNSTKSLLILTLAILNLSACSNSSGQNSSSSNSLNDNINGVGTIIETSSEIKFDTLSELEILLSLPFTTIIENDDKTTDEINELLLANSKAMNLYMSKYAKYSNYISRYGFLCEYYNSFYLTQEDLVELDYLDEEMLNENIVFLYIKPSSIFDDVSYSGSSSSDIENYEIYTAYENLDGVHIANTTNEDFTMLILRAEFDLILDKYNFYYGEIKGIKENSSDHLEIIDLIRQQNNRDETQEYDVRYLFKDDKYAVATVSPKGDTRSVTQYILEKNENSWEVAIANVEKLSNFAVDINKILPNFNLELLKDCNIESFRGYIDRIDIEAVIDAMILSGAISEENRETDFATSSDDFIYVEFKTGEKFIGSKYLNDEVFTVYPIKDYTEAILLLEKLHRKPPLFIVKQY